MYIARVVLRTPILYCIKFTIGTLGLFFFSWPPLIIQHYCGKSKHKNKEKNRQEYDTRKSTVRIDFIAYVRLLNSYSHIDLGVFFILSYTFSNFNVELFSSLFCSSRFNTWVKRSKHNVNRSTTFDFSK